jgi:hypothetical protein
MRTRTTSVLLVLMLGATIGTSVAFAGDQRSVNGQFTAQAGPAEPRCGDDLTLGFEIRGVASHLGAMTGTGSNCTAWTLATSAVAIWDGLATFVAADGSTLNTVSEGTQDAPVAGVAAFEATHTIIGGTGRFAGASGLWIVTGTIDFTTGAVSGQAAGRLSY